MTGAELEVCTRFSPLGLTKYTLDRHLKTSKRPGARLPIVQLQKERYPRSQPAEIFQIRIVPIQVR